MNIETKISLYCPSGFYCRKIATSNNRCCHLNTGTNHPYCEVFYPVLEKDSNGNILKCEACLLAERKARAGK